MGNGTEVRRCVEADCPLECGSQAWGSWGPCSVICGRGVRRRTRAGLGTSPDTGEQECLELTEQEECELEPCEHEGAASDGKLFGKVAFY